MAEITLVVEGDRFTGSAESRRLRRGGRIPAVVYGHGITPLAVSVGARDLRAALSTEAGLNALLSLSVGGDSHLALAREIQRHPVRGTVTHVDFQVVDRDQTVAADVTISLSGEAIEVHHADGIVDQQLFTLAIKAKPADIPPSLEIDISGLTLGSALRVRDLALPAGVETDLDPETVVVQGIASRAARAEEEEGAEAAEGAAAEGAAAEGAGASGSGGAEATGAGGSGADAGGES